MPPGSAPSNITPVHRPRGVLNNTQSRPTPGTSVNGTVSGGLVAVGTSLAVPVVPGGTVATGTAAPTLTEAGDKGSTGTTDAGVSSTGGPGTRGGSVPSNTATGIVSGGASISTEASPAHGTPGSVLVGGGTVAEGTSSTASARHGTAATEVTTAGNTGNAGASGSGASSGPGPVTGSVTSHNLVNKPAAVSMNTVGAAAMGTSSSGMTGGAEAASPTNIVRPGGTSLTGAAATVVSTVGNKESATVSAIGETSVSSTAAAAGTGASHTTPGNSPDGIARNSTAVPGESATGNGIATGHLVAKDTSSRNATRHEVKPSNDAGRSGASGTEEPAPAGHVTNGNPSSLNHAVGTGSNALPRHSPVTSLGARGYGDANIALDAESTTTYSSTASGGTGGDGGAGDTISSGRRVNLLPPKDIHNIDFRHP
ncbi:uncharacterized protein LOC142563840 [Dermacentor variabilis]|uniref:uncharacterized protein LOC142563840 n=1 Tax=Dermacentor variabilis TaxID=34621 RepID=UPI003F5C18FC